MNCIACARISCTSIEPNGKTFAYKMLFSPSNYCLIHRIFIFWNKTPKKTRKKKTKNETIGFNCEKSIIMRIILFRSFVTRCNLRSIRSAKFSMRNIWMTHVTRKTQNVKRPKHETILCTTHTNVCTDLRWARYFSVIVSCRYCYSVRST